MNNLKVVIIDDEEQSRLLLRIALCEYIDDIIIVGEGHDVASGIRIIEAQVPDLVFLDIDLLGGTGFDILDNIEDIKFNIIFFTAYNQYAIKAIRYSAFDYLLKPLSIDELEKAIARVKNQFNLQSVRAKFLKENLYSRSRNINNIIIPISNGYELLSFTDIFAIQANGNYVFFIVENNKKYLVAKSLNYYEDLLPDNIFHRIHKSHIINIEKLTNIEMGRTGKASLSNGMILDIAARRKSHFLNFVKLNKSLNQG